MHSFSAIVHSLFLHSPSFFSRTGRRRCMGNPLACRMFSYSCTVWVSLPLVLLGPYSFPNRLQSLSSLPSNILPILVIFIIRSRSFLLLVQHTNSPSAISTRSSYHLHSLQPRVDSLITFLFIIGRHNTCVYFLLFYSLNSIVPLFYSSSTPKSSAVRTRSETHRNSLSSIDRLVLRLGVVYQEFGNELSVYRCI